MKLHFPTFFLSIVKIFPYYGRGPIFPVKARDILITQIDCSLEINMLGTKREREGERERERERDSK